MKYGFKPLPNKQKLPSPPMAKAYPKTWKLVSNIYKNQWVKEKWEGFVKKTNQTDLKSSVAKHIVMTRTKNFTSDILSTDPKFTQGLASGTTSICWYLSLEDFRGMQTILGRSIHTLK